MITLAKLKKHIKRCKATNERFNFLGLLENEDITKEVENLFKFIGPTGSIGYDWVNGNNDLTELIKVN